MANYSHPYNLNHSQTSWRQMMIKRRIMLGLQLEVLSDSDLHQCVLAR